MRATIDLTEEEIEKLAELTDTVINCDTCGIYDDDVEYAIRVLIQNC